jgi:hypothetical protein
VSQYSEYLAVRDNEVFFAYADFEALEQLDTGSSGGGGGGGGSGGDFDFEEPMLSPASVIVLIGFSAGFQLGSLGLGGLIQTEGESNLNSQGNQILISNETLAVLGDMDTDEVDERLTASSGENSFSVQYEQVDESDGYTFYKPAGGSGGGGQMGAGIVAVSGSELFSANSRGAVDATIAATNGDGTATDEFDEFQWLLDNGGDGLIALGGYGPNGFRGSGGGSGGGSGDTSLDFVEGGGGFVGSITLDGGSANSVLAASSDQISETDQSQIESDFESDRTDVSIDFKGNGRLVAEATYSRDVLESGGSSSGS